LEKEGIKEEIKQANIKGKDEVQHCERKIIVM
jgi:hypothetical protein